MKLLKWLREVSGLSWFADRLTWLTDVNHRLDVSQNKGSTNRGGEQKRSKLDRRCSIAVKIMQTTQSSINSKPLQSAVFMETKQTSKSFRLVVLFCLLVLVVYSVGLTIFVAVLARNHSSLQTYATRLEKRVDTIEETVSRLSKTESQSQPTQSPDDVERLIDEVRKITTCKTIPACSLSLLSSKSKHWNPWMIKSEHWQ